MTRVTDPLGRTTQYEYDASDNLTTMVDGNRGNTTTYDYDPLDRLIRTRDAEGNETSTDYSYYPSKTPSPRSTCLGHRTTYLYDALGRLEAVIDPTTSGSPRPTTPATACRRRWTRGELTSYSYDAMDRVTGTRTRLRTKRESAYDPRRQPHCPRPTSSARPRTTHYDKLDLGCRRSTRWGT